MKTAIKLLSAIPALVLVTVAVLASTPFIKTVAVVGGAPRQLSAVLANANYTGSPGVSDLELCNPSDAAGTLYVGSNSNVNASTGSKLVQSQCRHFPGSVNAGEFNDVSKIYVLTNANQNMEVWLNAR